MDLFIDMSKINCALSHAHNKSTEQPAHSDQRIRYSLF